MRLKPLPVILALIIGLFLFAVLFVGISYFRYSSDGAVLNYIRGHRNDVAIACLDPAEPDAGLYHNADEAYPLASTFKLVLLAAYAQEVAAGRMDPQEEIPLAELDRYYLPGTDGEAHPQFLGSLGEGRESLTLSEVADGMIIYSSNAAADYMGARLQGIDFADLYRRLGVEHTDLPFSYLGLYLFMTNHETGLYADEDITLQEARAEQQRLEKLFVTDADWRAAEIDFLRSLSNFAPLEVQRAVVTKYGMAGSARDLTQIMLAAYGYNDNVPAAAQEVMRRHLEWPIRLNPENGKVFEALASKSGAWPGVLTSAWYAQPLGDGRPRVLSVLYRDLPDDFWNAWVVSFSHQKLEAGVLIRSDCSILSQALQ
ncbi:MAG TPA: serine hydrolase [Anaerolineales bacterium]|jgi:hypothetical protein